MPAPPIVTGANLFRAKLVLTAADVAALDTTNYLMAPGMPGKILMPVAVIARMSNYTGSYTTSSGEAYVVFGPVFDNDKIAFVKNLQQIFADVQSDGTTLLVNDGGGNTGDFAGDPLYIAFAGGTFVTGAAVTATVESPGLLYAPGDTGLIDGPGEQALYTVLTVDGGGGVLTLSVSGGSGFRVSPGYGTEVLTGSGDGNLQVNITKIAPSATFTLEIDVIYQPI